MFVALLIGACQGVAPSSAPSREAPHPTPTEAEAPPTVPPEVSPPVSAVASAARDHRLVLSHAAHPTVEHAPDALLHVPRGAHLEGPFHVVLFLHGYSGCVEVLASSELSVRCRPSLPESRTNRGMPGFGVVEAHDAAGTDTILLIPQLAWMERDGSPGALGRPGEARVLIEEALASADLSTELASVTVVAHSAAFESALAVVRQGGLDDHLRSVVLLDALYSGGPAFLTWVRAGTEVTPRTLVSLYTGGTPRRQTEALAPMARRALGPGALIAPSEIGALAALDAPARALFLHVRGAHGDVPRRQLGPVLAALDLPRRSE